MATLYKRWDEPRSMFGDLVVVIFLVMQCLDGVFTYLGVSLWGPAVEANPLIASAMTAVGVIAGIGGAKLIAVAFRILLHLRRVHNLLAGLAAPHLPPPLPPRAAPF